MRKIATLSISLMILTVLFAPLLHSGRFSTNQPSNRIFLKNSAGAVSFETRHGVDGDFDVTVWTPNEGSTILNEVGRLSISLPQGQFDIWKDEFHISADLDRKIWLQLWLAEHEIANHEPDKGMERLDWVLARAKPHARVFGLARYADAIAHFHAGMYPEAAHLFEELAKQPLGGYSVRSATLWRQKASACANYHERNRQLGIKQPERLDPLCGVSAMAVVQRHFGRTHAKDELLKTVPYNGEGSTAADLVTAANRLGLRSYAVNVTEKGLRQLPLPAVAHVEHDHFVVVLKVSEEGVTYHCSDCGPWPGGEREVTWIQWRAMEADGYVVMALPGSQSAQIMDRAVSNATSIDTPNPIKIAALRIYRAQPMGQISATHVNRVVNALKGQLTVYVYPEDLACGEHPYGLKCLEVDCYGQVCPVDSLSSFGAIASVSSSMPLNLSSGEEEHTPVPDLEIYNPDGPSVVWARQYHTLNRVKTSFGYGWSHPYHMSVTEPTFKGSLEDPLWSGSVIFPNEGRVGFSSTQKPTSSTSEVDCTVAQGFPIKVKWQFVATNTYRFVIEFKDRTKWTTETLLTFNRAWIGDSAGLVRMVAKKEDRFGNEIKFVYENYQVPYGETPPIVHTESQRRLVRIDDEANVPLLTLSLDSIGNIQSATDRYGRAVQYEVQQFYNYDSIGGRDWFYDLTKVSKINGTVSDPRYAYTYARATTGLPSSGGNNEMVHYLKTVSAPNPTGSGMSTATINYGAIQMPVIASETDANGNVHEYDFSQDLKTVVSIKNPQGTLVHKYAVSFNNNMSLSKIWDANDNLVAELFYTDGARPFAPTSLILHKNSTESLNWLLEYGAGASLTKVTSPKGLITTYTYSYPSQAPLGQLDAVQEGTKTSTLFGYDSATGLITSVQAPIPGQSGTGNRQTSTISYTTKGNVQSITSPGNNATASHIVTYDYTNDGTFSQAEKFGQPLTITNLAGEKSHMRYDARGNTTKSWDHLGNDSIRYYENIYNIADDIIESSVPATGNSGPGRARSIYAYQYTGGPITSTSAVDESGSIIRTSNITYGPEGEVLSRTGDGEKVYVEYDAAGRTKKVKDGNQNVTEYFYNVLGNLTEVRHPLVNTGTGFDRTLFTSYNRLGDLLSRTDGRGIVTNFLYDDADGMLSDVIYPASDGEDIHIDYDSYGRESLVSDALGSVSSTYDDLNGTTASTRTYSGVGAFTFNYSYYPDGSRQSMSNLAGTWNYSYDSVGRWTSMSSPAGTVSTSYFGDGRQSLRILPNGVSTEYQYNAIGLRTLVSHIDVNENLQSVFNGFEYDGVFNLKKVVGGFNSPSNYSGSVNWTYDSNDRLTQELTTRAGGYTHTFAYDLADNPTTFKGVSQTFNADNQRTGTGFAYDGNGNPTTYAGGTATFDQENRLTSYSGDTHSYRADGLRANIDPATGAKYWFLYDGGRAIVELNDNATVRAINVYAPDGLVARKLGSTWTYYQFDQQGNVCHRSNASGTVTSSSVCDAYGLETSTATQTDPFGYNAQWGYYFDRDSGLYYCQARFFDPVRGRWLNRDPIGFSGGMNLYGYCGQGPVEWADTSGKGAFRIAYYIFRKADNAYLKCGSTSAGAARYKKWWYECNGYEMVPAFEGQADEVLKFERSTNKVAFGPLNNERYGVKNNMHKYGENFMNWPSYTKPEIPEFIKRPGACLVGGPGGELLDILNPYLDAVDVVDFVYQFAAHSPPPEDLLKNWPRQYPAPNTRRPGGQYSNPIMY